MSITGYPANAKLSELNGNRSGGTRLNAGKPSTVWLPTAIIGSLMARVRNAEGYIVDPPDEHLQRAMSLLFDGTVPPNLSLFQNSFMELVWATEATLYGETGDNGRHAFREVLNHACIQSEYGAQKYTPLDWHSGQDFSVLVGCAYRHMVAMWVAEDVFAVDPESGTTHLGAAAWNLLCLCHLMLTMPECDDISPEIGRTLATAHL